MTLIELVMFIVVVGVGIAGILAVLTVSTKSSADPMARKNMLSIAEALLEEVEMMPYTYCDPTDANVATATSATVGAGGCATTVEAMGPDVGETRTSATNPFNNVNDYGPSLSIPTQIPDVSNTYFGPAGYSATIQVAASALNDIASTDALRIAVTVSYRGDSLTLEGFRARHSPNWVP